MGRRIRACCIYNICMLTSLFFFSFLFLQIPFDNFVRTNLGEMSTNQMKMFREKVKSVGISMLGGNSGVEGKYELGIDSIRVVNEDDVVHTSISSRLSTSCTLFFTLIFTEVEDPQTGQESPR
jgi:Complex I intermediate-associated protein 30 (CIA30)